MAVEFALAYYAHLGFTQSVLILFSFITMLGDMFNYLIIWDKDQMNLFFVQPYVRNVLRLKIPWEYVKGCEILFIKAPIKSSCCCCI